MNKQNVEDLYPLSPLQQGMLFHTLLAPESGAYVEQITYEMVGWLRTDLYRRVWQEALERHPVLRTAFFWEKLPKPLQVVHRRLELPVHEEDLRGMPQGERQAHVDAFVESDRLRGFDMAQAPLLRLALFRTGEDGWTGVLSFHHILLDGWSMPIVFQEAHFAYEALVQGQRAEIPRPRPFRDYIGWLGTQDLAQAEAFWRRALAGFAEPSTPRFAPPAFPVAGYHKAQARVGSAVGALLQGLARRHKVTLNTVVQAAWALLLARYSGSDDVVFGATVSGRPAELDGVERMVGMFINSLPLRARADASLTVGEWVERLQAFSTEARQFEHAPLVEVQGWSDVPRDRPLFETLYVFENMPLRPRTDHQGLAEGGEAEAAPTGRGSMRMVTARSPERTNFPLLLVIAPEGDELALRLTVDTARYDAGVGERMLAHLVAVLGEFAARPGVRLGEVQVMTADEARRLDALSRGPVDTAPDACLHALFEAQADRTPDAVALLHEGARVTYAELDARANRLARHLAGLGVGRGATVGVCLERTPEMVVALLAVLKAGGAYVPLDPAYPAERLEFMLADSGAAAVVTDAAAAARIAPGGAQVVRVDADARAIAAHGAERMESPVTPDDLAYVIFTSGSTGRPKGVMIEHRSSARIVRWVGSEHTDAERACVLGATSISFDVSIAEIFGTLCWGGTLLLVENALSLASLDDSAGVVTAVMVPTAAAELLRMGGIPRTVRTMDLAGEPLPASLAQRLYATGHVRVIRNLYGPTEDTTYSTASTVQEGGGRVYVGRPVSNTRALVLDDGYRPVPLGIPGELYLAGEGVTRGYLGRPALTAERYLPDPSGPAGGRMYRVMDRVRWSEGGELEYIERVDHQVKIRGYRVELGEIEAALGEHAGVGECAVTAFGEGDAPRELVAYWVPATVDAPSVAELRGHLKGRLPGYMVPTYFVVLRELPRTPNGKVDRRALPAPHGAGRAGGEYVPPRNATETALAAIWREVLGVERVGVHDSFFDLGGHSLKATQVVSRVREALGTALPIRAIFEAPTLAELALRCGAGGAEAESAIARVADEGGVPLSFAQERLWFLDRMEPGQSTYNIPFALRVDGALDADALERAIAEVVRRHDQLRASFREVDGRPVQVFAPAGEFRLRVEDLSHLSPAEREAEVERRVHADAVRPFDLARGPLFRAALLRLSARDHVLSLNFHHSISDGWSFGVFFREVTQLYAAFQAGRPSPLPELEVQYADYAAWQRTQLSGDALAADVEFWRAALAGAPPLLELPTDRPRPAAQTYSGATMTVAYPAELSERLGAVARAHGASLFQALLAAFHALIARYSGQDDVVVGTPLAGRTRPETEALIGFFINTLPVRGDLGGDPTFRELLGRTREATLGVYAHQELPFEKLVEELQPERSLAYGPYFQVLFGLQNRGMSDLRLGDLAVRQVPVGATDSKLDLGFSLADTEGGIAGSIEYNPDLFDADTIRRMSARYLRLLQAVADDPDARVLRVPLADADELAAVASFASAPVAAEIVARLLSAASEVSADGSETADRPARTLRVGIGVDAESPVAEGVTETARVYVLGAALEPMPVGMPGEICIGGIRPSRGTQGSDRYLPDPYASMPGMLLHRTGDRGRWRADGSLEPMGRMGEQVTLRGTRIALADVEAALAAHPHVARAVAVVRTDGGDRRLAAYVVPREGAPVDADEVRAHAARVLPEAMVPAAVVVLPALPLMANGRVDRGALPAPAGFAAAADEHVEPATATERALAAIYAELLGARKVGAGDDFFALGGHSLLATRLVSRIRAELGAEIALRTVFQSPSVAALAALVDAAAGPRTGRDLPLAGAAPVQDAPLSFAQERLWFLDQMEPGSATYNLPITLRLRGALDADALRRSLGEIARRHEVLRAVFRDRDGRPVQHFVSADGFALPVDDISGLGADALEAEIAARVRDESLAPFSLADGPLFRAELLRAGPADHVLLVNMHHAVSDGWSIGILVRELTALYAAFSAGRPSPLPELPVRYADFAAWQRGWLTGEVLDGQVAFWRRTLEGAPALLELTTDRPRPAVQTYCGANFDIAFPGGLLEPLSALARTEGASVFMALMGAFQVLMARYSGQDDVVVGTPIAGRNRAELEGLIGFFVNTLPIRGDLAGDPTFRQLLRRVREATLDAYAHQDLPFEKLVAELHPERSLSHGPVFQVMFTLQNLPPGGLALGDVAIEQVAGQEVAAKYDLAFTLAESEAGLGGSIQYNPDLFDTATIERMAAHFGRLLAAFAADPDARVWRVPLMDAEERTRVVDGWNATAAPFPATRCVHELFTEQALRTPHAPAVEGGGARLTYAELDAAANRLAHRLRARGVGPEVPVAVSLDRSPEMVVALLAVLKAGGAYLPLDPAYPLDRRAFMLRDSGTRVVISRPELAGDVAAEGGELVTPDAAFDPSLDPSLPAVLGTPDNLAYVTYTSGSTGLPKGVMVPHRGVANLVQAQVRAFELRAGTRVLQFASLSFDAAASETFTTLLSGGTLVLAARDALLPGDPLLGTLTGERVEVITLPPSVLAALPPEALPALRTVVSAGEACTADVARRWSGPLVPGATGSDGVRLPGLELRDAARRMAPDGDAEPDAGLSDGSAEEDDAVPAGHSG